MEASIMTIGDELLIGQVVDTNSAFMAQRLNEIGISVKQILSVGDRKEEIMKGLDRAGAETSLVLVTGGLGPTSDDITKPTICEYFGTQLKEDHVVLEQVQSLLAGRGVGMNEKNRQQASVPATAKVIRNRVGTAPCLWMEKEQRTYIFMPGVPFEMKTILTEELIPRFLRMYTLPALVHRTILTQGIPESFLADKLTDFEKNIPANVRLAYLPSPGMVRLRLTATGEDKSPVEVQLENLVNQLKQILGTAIYGFEEDRLEQVIGKMLLERNATLATAESCTGGAISAAITSVPGSSDYFKGGVVAYSNRLKIELLEVDEMLIRTHGAVSHDVVSAMARGIREKTGADYSIATSGIAGPGGGVPGKPVGTIWIAVSSVRGEEAREYHFGEDRGRNILRTVQAGLDQLRKYLLNN